MEKKYRLLENDTITVSGRTLYRIEALRDFADVEKGDKGGYVEKEDNLSHEGNCWVSDNARVYDNALVGGNAWVYGDARVSDNARVSDDAWVAGKAWVYDNARVSDKTWVFGGACVYDKAVIGGKAEVCGEARISSITDYYVGKNIWSSGRYFTYTHSNKMWQVGCFHGTSEELIRKAYQDSEVSGREYERVVRYVEAMYADLENDKSK